MIDITNIPNEIKDKVIFAYHNTDFTLQEICHKNNISTAQGRAIAREYENGIIKQHKEKPKEPISNKEFNIPTFTNSSAKERFIHAPLVTDEHGNICKRIPSNPKMWELND